MTTFIQQECIKLIKSQIKDLNLFVYFIFTLIFFYKNGCQINIFLFSCSIHQIILKKYQFP